MEAPGINTFYLRGKIGLFLGFFLFVLLLLAPPFGGIEPLAKKTLAVAVLMATWWITEAIPLAITALLPIPLFPILGIASAQDTSANYADKNIFLFVGGFLLAFAIERAGLHRRFALQTISLVGTKPASILLAFMLTTWFMSMWMSNTACTLVMLPIGLAVLRHIKSHRAGSNQDLQKPGDANAPGELTRSYEFAELLMLAIAYSASIGGIATLVGTPPNMILKGFVEKEFPAVTINFAKWMIMVTPLSLVFLALVWVIFVRLVSPSMERQDGQGMTRHYLREELRKLGRLTKAEKMILTVFIATVVFWVFRADIALGFATIPGWSRLFKNPALFDDSTVAMAMAILCFFLPTDFKRGQFLLGLEEVKRLPWHIILLFGGGFALAYGISATALDVFIASKLLFLHYLPVFLVVAVVCTVMTFLTEITSNTAITSALLPVLAPLAVPLGLNPLVILLPATLNASFAFMLPVATPPNAIVFGTGYVRMSTMVRVGFLMNLIGIVLTTILISVVRQAL